MVIEPIRGSAPLHPSTQQGLSRPRSEPGQRIAPWGRADWLLVGALLLAGLLLALMVATQWLEPDDDGLYLYQANAVLHGGVPYRDFFLHDAPLGPAWHALLLALFGNDALVLRLALVPFKALVLPGIYVLARPLVPRGPALLAALSVPVVDNTNQYTAPHVAFNAAGLGVVAVVLLARWGRRPHPVWLVGAGALLGAMTGFKQNMGLYLLGGAALWLLDAGWAGPDTPAASNPRATCRLRLWRAALRGAAVISALWLVRARPDPDVLLTLVLPLVALAGAALRLQPTAAGAERRILGSWAALGAGFLVGAVPWLAWAVLGAGLPAVFDGLVRVPGDLAAVWFTGLRPPVPAFWWVLGLYGAGVALAAALLAMARTRRGQPLTPWLVWGGMVGGGAVLAILTPLLQSVTTGLIYTWLYFNVLVFWPLFLAVERIPPGGQRTHARLMLIAATFLALEMYPTLVRGHANYCFVLFLPLVAWLLWRAAEALRRLAPAGVPGHVGAAPAVALAVLPALALNWTLSWHLGLFIDLRATWQSGRVVAAPWVPLGLPHLHLLETPDDQVMYQRIANAVTSRTQPDEAIYCYFGQPAFYFAANRRPAIANVYAAPGTTSADGVAMRDALVQSGVRIIVANTSVLQPDPHRDPRVPAATVDWYAPIRNYIHAGFHQVESDGPWSVWVRGQ